MRSLPKTLLACLLLLALPLWAQSNLVAGRDYQPINPPQPTDGDAAVEVLEFFAYGCIHCYTLEPKLEEWAKKLPKDTKVKRIPTNFALRGVNNPQIYYTLEAMGLIDKLHLKIFEALHKENLNLGNPSVRDQWLTRQGVDLKKYQEVERSFTVDNKVKRAHALTQNYRIESTPTLVVGGRFMVPNTSPERALQVVDGLAGMLRAAAQIAASAPAPAAATPAASKAPGK